MSKIFLAKVGEYWLIFFLLFLLYPTNTKSQSTYVPLNHWVYNYIDRLETKRIIKSVLNNTKPLSRMRVAKYLFQLHKQIDAGVQLNKVEQEQLLFLDNEFKEELNQLNIVTTSYKTRLTKIVNSNLITKILPNFVYRNDRNFLCWEQDQFRVYFDPILNHQQEYIESDTISQTGKIFQFTNGGRLWGNVGDYLGFFVDARDTKEWGTRKYKIGNYTLPRLGFVRAISPDFIYHDETDAYIKIGYKAIDIVYGKFKNYWGPGYTGSLILSDYATSYDQLKLEVSFSKFKFTSMYAYLIDYEFQESDKLQKRKYLAGHRLEFMPWSWISIGMSEVVIFKGRSFEPSYLNPVMFYRSAEHYLGSPDNMMLGLDFKCFPIRNLKAYGELLIDDITTTKLGTGWYGNKLAFLFGIFFTDVCTFDNLDFRLEYVRLRPYTYTHENSINYTHYHSTLGHWSGPNSDYLLIDFDYQYSRYLKLSMYSELWRHGANYTNKNVGGDIQHYFHEGDEYVKFLAGNLSKQKSFGFNMRYELFRGFYFDVGYSQYKGSGVVDNRILAALGLNK